MNIIARMLIGGILPAAAWLLFFYIQIQSAHDYGMAILPALLIAVALFIVGAVIGALIKRG